MKHFLKRLKYLASLTESLMQNFCVKVKFNPYNLYSLLHPAQILIIDTLHAYNVDKWLEEEDVT